MIVDDDQYHNSLEVSKQINQEHYPQNYNQFFKNYPSENDCFYIKDPVFDLGYIPANPIMILESKGYTLIDKQFINQIDINSIKTKRFLSFITQASIFLLLYYERSIVIYALSKNEIIQEKYKTIDFENLSNRIRFRIDEAVIEMQTIKNEEDIPYFILVTNHNRVLFLTLRLNPFEYQLTDVKPKTSLVSSVFSYFSFSHTNTYNSNISACSILNPFSYTKMTKGNKKNNCLIILTQTSIRMFNFEINAQSIIHELSIDQDIFNSILSQINDYCQSYHILSSDVYYNITTKVIQVTAIAKTSNYHFYLIRIDIDESRYITYHHLNITQYFDNNSFFNPYLFLNKYQDEGMIINDSFLIYFNRHNQYSSEFRYSIKGVNPHITPEHFSIDIFAEHNGVINIKALKSFEKKDITDVFLRKFHVDHQIINQQTKSLLSSQNYKEQTNKSAINLFNSFNTSKSILINQSFQVDSSSTSNNSITVLLKDKFRNYCSKQRINESRQEMNNLFQTNPHELIYKSIQDIISRKVNDDTLNIENINRSNYKAELVIIAYLQNKFNYVFDFFNFLVHYNIFSKYEQFNHAILLLLIKTMEKLIVLIEIRKKENSIEDSLNNNSSTDFGSDNNIIMAVLDNFYRSLKTSLNSETMSFSKQYLYGKLSHINWDFIQRLFLNYQMSYQNCLLLESKIELTKFFVQLINSINSRMILCIDNIIAELKSNKLNISALLLNQKDNFWCMSISLLNDNMLMIYHNAIDLRQKDSFISKIDDELMLYCELMLYFYEMYYSQNTSPKDKRDYYETKKKVIGSLINDESFKQALEIAKKYDDYYNISFICYHWKEYDELKQYINGKNNNKITIFLIQQLLFFECKRIEDFQKNMEHYITFDLFDSLNEYQEEISSIVQDYPKLKSFYSLYLNQFQFQRSQNRVSIERLIPEINSNKNIVSFIMLEKIQSIINKSILSTQNKTDDLHVDLLQEITEYDIRLRKEDYSEILAIFAKHFKYEIKAKPIFEQISNIIENIIQGNNQIYTQRERLFIALYLLKFGASINILESEFCHHRLIMIYKEAHEFDYQTMKSLILGCGSNTIDNMTDSKRNEMSQRFITNRFEQVFPETQNESEIGLEDFRNANDGDSVEEQLRLEYYEIKRNS